MFGDICSWCEKPRCLINHSAFHAEDRAGDRLPLWVFIKLQFLCIWKHGEFRASRHKRCQPSLQAWAESRGAEEYPWFYGVSDLTDLLPLLVGLIGEDLSLGAHVGAKQQPMKEYSSIWTTGTPVVSLLSLSLPSFYQDIMLDTTEKLDLVFLLLLTLPIQI